MTASEPTFNAPRWSIRIVGMLLSAVAIVILAASVDLAQVGTVLAEAAPLPILAAGGLVFVQLALVTTRWSLLLPRPPHRGRVTWRELIRPVALGYLGNFVLPARLGELIRAAYASRRWRLGVAQTLGSVALERVVDTAVLAVIALVVAWVLGAPGWVIQVAGLAAAAGLAVLFMLASGIGPDLAERLTVGSAPRLVREAGMKVREFLIGASGRGRARTVVLAAVLSLSSWLVEGVVYWLVGEAVGLSLTFAEAMLVAAITVLATAIPSAPAYLGTFELAVTSVAGALGHPPAAALAWGVVAHVVTVVPLLLAGLAALLTAGRGLQEIIDDARSVEGERSTTS
jgi:uncharacterized protein (TIRG00374 family)